jgi:tetratricopeptide (TPR) repeat protein
VVCSTRLGGMPRFWFVPVLLLCATLAGCTTVGRSDGPAVVVDRTQPPTGGIVVPRFPDGAAVDLPAEPLREVPEVAAYRPPTIPQYRRPAPNRAVTSLMRQADEAVDAGQPASAAATLERALRIAPDDAELWSRLAAARLAEGQYDKVQPLAAKSNALAAPLDDELRGRNWGLIAAARRALGDTAGARDAAARASALRP